MSLVRIAPSCTWFSREAMWQRGARIHPAFRSAVFERTDGVGPARSTELIPRLHRRTPPAFQVEGGRVQLLELPAFMRIDDD